MATAAHEFSNNRRNGPMDRRHELAGMARSTEGMRISWGGIWGGVLTAVGLLLLLAALGLAVGITAVDPQQADASTLGGAAGIWAGLSLLLALFVGGMVSTRVGAISDRATGFWEGALVWVVSLLLMAYLATSGISSLASGAMSMMGGAKQAASSVTQSSGGAAGMVDQMKSKMSDPSTTSDLQQKAADAKPTASKAAWGTFGALVLSLLAAVFGAMTGRRRHLPRA